MESFSLFPLVVLILGTLAPWTVEGAQKSLKAGGCPPLHIRCFQYEEECQSDQECSENMKCCQHSCGTRCLYPLELPTEDWEKPGHCPQVHAKCKMLNPPNECENDDECENNFKCCKGTCGKTCVSPVTESFSKGGSS